MVAEAEGLRARALRQRMQARHSPQVFRVWLTLARPANVVRLKGLPVARSIRTLRGLFPPGFSGPSGVLEVMYAVIATGGKQYRVAEGSVVRVEKLEAEA